MCNTYQCQRKPRKLYFGEWARTPDKLKGINVGEIELNLDKLSYAVGRHETGNCSIKTNFTILNNCHGIKIQGRPARFPGYINGQRFETSGDYFKDLWFRKYKRFPGIELATLYSGNDRAGIWLENVTTFYNL